MRNILLIHLLLLLEIAAAQVAPKLTEHQLVLEYLETQSEIILSPEAFQDAELSSSYYDKNMKANYAYFRQRVNRLPVFNAHAGATIRNGEVVHFWEGFYKDLQNPEAHTLSESDVLKAYLTSLGYSGPLRLKKQESAYVFEENLLADQPIAIRKGFYLKEGKLIATYEVEHVERNRAHWYLIQFDAQTGAEIDRLDYTVECMFDGHDHSHSNHSTGQFAMPEMTHSAGEATQSATGTYEVFAYPIESPNHGSRSLESDSDDEEASPYGWHDVNGDDNAEFTITRGNNVHASEDRDADNNPGLSPDGGSSLLFQAPFDNNQSAQLYVDAAVINLFYWNNIMHDVFWHYGFDEPAGNFQQNNYGNGGVGGDYVRADAQDGSGMNNANFQTPPDGNNGRMQMFLWGSNIPRDFMQVNSPAVLAAKVTAVQAQASIAKRLTADPITAEIVLVEDGTGNNRGCNTLTNTTELNGKIAFIDRGGCTFIEKLQAAERGGAIAVIVANNSGTNPIAMGGNGYADIPAVMITQNAGSILKNELISGPVEVSLYDSSNIIVPGTRDSDFDNGVIVHEYTHGISIRLAGGPANSGCLNSLEQMGEGWSDFLGLVMTHQPDDKPEDARGIGTYSAGQGVNGRGIRPFPYSVDMNRNPVTYDDIKRNEFTVPHGVGSVWCSMLWDLYWNMIDKHGYDQDIYKGNGGNNMTMHLVLDGLKLINCSPGFIDGRDAILEADRLRYDGANQKLIWETFARRGLGFSASQGSPNNKVDGIEAFDVPNIFGNVEVTKSGPELAEVGDTLIYNFKIKNSGEEPVENISVGDTVFGGGFLFSLDNACDLTFRGNEMSLTIPKLEAGDSLECRYAFKTDNNLKSERYFYDDAEGDSLQWFTTIGTGTNVFTKTGDEVYDGDSSFYVASVPTRSDARLKRELNLVNAAAPYLVFKHKYNTEFTGDGGVLEANAIGIWQDLGNKMIVNGYNNSILRTTPSSIAGRQAFTGESNGWVTTVVDLSDYAGQVIDIRFRFGTDEGGAVGGWYIDDIEVYYELAIIESRVTATAPDMNPAQAQTLTLLLPTSDTVEIVPGFKERLQVYPNPTTDVFHIEFTSPNARLAAYQIADISGKVVASGEIETNVENTVDVRHLADGIYIVELKDGVNLRQTKVLKVTR
jgi:extracellular elastinolytic metalloproteinase